VKFTMYIYLFKESYAAHKIDTMYEKVYQVEKYYNKMSSNNDAKLSSATATLKDISHQIV